MLIVPLSSEEATLGATGGKGANLSALIRAGFPVPPCVALSTSGYEAFVEANGLSPIILGALEAARPADPDSLADTSRSIRNAFSAAAVPGEISEAIDTATAYLNERRLLTPEDALGPDMMPLAVRSSATAEDLPDLSFAGQQDTFLNVVGREALLRAVVDCWSSLWTARAIGYRERNGISHDDVALAVLIQEMVPSDSSGVLFTANPLTGSRTEMVIDATFGLGEALVSGQVEPDHYVVDVVEVATAAAIVDKRLGAKALAIMSQAGGGIERVSVAEGERPAISDEIVLELVSLGGRVAELFGAAQDIEWTLSEGVIYLLQSRPITSLYPLSNGITVSDEQGLRVLFSFGAIQGMLDPMTPLGRDAIKGLFAGGGRIFGYQLTPQSQRVILAAGERLYVDMTSPLRHTIGQKMVGNSMGLVEPGTAAALEEFLSETRLTRSARIRPRTVWRLLKFLAPTAARLLLAMIRPDRRRAKIQNRIERTYLQHESQFEAANTLSSRLACFEGMLDEAFPSVFPDFLPAIAGGMMSLNALKRISAHLGLSGDEALMITRGMPYNVTTEMDLALWATASAIKADREAAAYFAAADASEASADFLQGRLPEAGQSALESFMQRYGMRGTAEIDLGRARWREEPLPVMRSLQSYLGIEEADLAPDVVFERGMLAAAAAESRIIEAMMKTRFGRPKALLVHFFSDRMRALAGLRESPKFLIMRLMGIAREALLASGQELVGQEILEEADDIFFLDLTELRELAKGDTVPGRDARAWRQLVATRRGDYQRERRRRQIPRLMLSDGRSYYEGIAASGAENGDNLVGSPVSPGVVEGIVRVVFDPAQAGLRPGEILVCPGTDPAWTPLFLAAGGLVTEVGGLMTHGSVVAREYGIPAVVGVHEATKRLKTGQKVRIDGGTGVIVNCEL